MSKNSGGGGGGACPQTPLASSTSGARLVCLPAHKFLATAMISVRNAAKCPFLAWNRVSSIAWGGYIDLPFSCVFYTLLFLYLNFLAPWNLAKMTFPTMIQWKLHSLCSPFIFYFHSKLTSMLYVRIETPEKITGQRRQLLIWSGFSILTLFFFCIFFFLLLFSSCFLMSSSCFFLTPLFPLSLPHPCLSDMGFVFLYVECVPIPRTESIENVLLMKTFSRGHGQSVKPNLHTLK